MLSQIGLAAGIGFAGVLGIGLFNPDTPFDAEASSANVTSTCTIKGNVSHNTGERIYHVPGQKYYSETVISARFGERWFCSEAEARAAGWRRSRV